MVRAPGDKHEFAKIFAEGVFRAGREFGAARTTLEERKQACVQLPPVLAVTKSATAWDRRVTFNLPKMFAR